MTIGQKIFYLLSQKNMTQKEFSDRTGISTTTISDWKKKNTNPGSEKIMSICAALDVTPEYLLSGVTEDSDRGHDIEYLVLPRGTEERELIEIFNDIEWFERSRLLEYARKLAKHSSESEKYRRAHTDSSMVKIAEFCDIEMYIDSEFKGEPSLEINYLDDDIQGSIDLKKGTIEGDFSKYIIPVIREWYSDHKARLIQMWDNHTPELIEAWD